MANYFFSLLLLNMNHTVSDIITLRSTCEGLDSVGKSPTQKDLPAPETEEHGDVINVGTFVHVFP